MIEPLSHNETNETPFEETLSIALKDKAVLYATYMSWIKQGGVFIPTRESYELGTPISMIIDLMEETEQYAVKGRVVWITPVGAQGNRAAGIGVQFQGEEGVKIQNKIITYLAGALQSDRSTHTL